MAKVFTITEGLENMGALKTGGQGSVYKGRRIGEIITAIKLLPTPIYSESADDKNFISFQNEVQKLKKVNEEPNPNVVKILHFGITDSGNFPFIEMEFIEGPDLEELLKPPHDPVFSVKEVLKVADQLSHALAHCHKVGVRHGDIKSNNVKFNTRTGNYILLDFGLSLMSDEERRSSLRHAGAIEFMAPEQNEGQMLFQTDVYSFGIVMFELLAGTVPFPLKDKGETSRNMVMVAHMETPPPNVLILRKKALPQSWTEQRKQVEMHVPDWLINMIYKCLEKKPENRFANGEELYDYIWQNSIRTVGHDQELDDQLRTLQQENKRLLQEKEQLRQQLVMYQQSNRNNLNTATNNADPYKSTENVSNANTSKSSSLFTSTNLLIFFVVIAAIAGIVCALVATSSSNTNPKNVGSATQAAATKKTVIGQYRVVAAKAYFYNQPDLNSQREAYAVPSDDIVKAYDDKNGFVYTQMTNSQGQVSKGWLRKQDLANAVDVIPGDKKPSNNIHLSQTDINAQLKEARQFFNSNQLEDALGIYGNLSQQQVPEAMYEYANLALQNHNDNINCNEAFQLLTNAAVKNYAPAKRTLGFLYAYADDEEVLRNSNYYERCSFNKNLPRGSQLLLEAMLQGDTTASRLLDELNSKDGSH